MDNRETMSHMASSTLIEFLQLCLEEERNAARELIYAAQVLPGQIMPLRMLDDAESKLRIVERVIHAIEDGREAEAEQGEAILRLLAWPYRDHPAYRDEWAPPAWELNALLP